MNTHSRWWILCIWDCGWVTRLVFQTKLPRYRPSPQERIVDTGATITETPCASLWEDPRALASHRNWIKLEPANGWLETQSAEGRRQNLSPTDLPEVQWSRRQPASRAQGDATLQNTTKSWRKVKALHLGSAILPVGFRPLNPQESCKVS